MLLVGVAGFIVLASSILNNWKAGSRGKEEVDALQSKRNREQMERERENELWIQANGLKKTLWIHRQSSTETLVQIRTGEGFFRVRAPQ